MEETKWECRFCGFKPKALKFSTEQKRLHIQGHHQEHVIQGCSCSKVCKRCVKDELLLDGEKTSALLPDQGQAAETHQHLMSTAFGGDETKWECRFCGYKPKALKFSTQQKRLHMKGHHQEHVIQGCFCSKVCKRCVKDELLLDGEKTSALLPDQGQAAETHQHLMSTAFGGGAPDETKWECRFCGYKPKALKFSTQQERLHMQGHHQEHVIQGCFSSVVCNRCVKGELLLDGEKTSARLPDQGQAAETHQHLMSTAFGGGAPGTTKTPHRFFSAVEREGASVAQAESFLQGVVSVPGVRRKKRWAKGVLRPIEIEKPAIDDDHGATTVDDRATITDSLRGSKRQKVKHESHDESEKSAWAGFQRGGDLLAATKTRILDRGMDPALVLSVLSQSDRDGFMCFLEGLGQGKVAHQLTAGVAASGQDSSGCEVQVQPDLEPQRSSWQPPQVQLPEGIPDDFGVLLVQGPSGSGVTRMLQALREHLKVPSASNVFFNDSDAVASVVENARDVFPRVGLNDIRSWCRPYKCLSNGQRQRVRLARLLETANRHCGVVVDDLGAAVDEVDGRAIAHSLGLFFRGRGGGAPFRNALVGTHADLAAYLQPDWVVRVDGVDKPAELWKNPVPWSERRAQLELRMGSLGRCRLPTDPDPVPKPPRLSMLRRQLSQQHDEGFTCSTMQLSCTVRLDERVLAAAAAFELDFDGSCVCQVPLLPESLLNSTWRVGLVVGPSGSGKTTALRRVLSSTTAQLPGPSDINLPQGAERDHQAEATSGSWSWAAPWDPDQAVISQIPGDAATVQELLSLTELPRPSWQRPFVTLSTSEQARARLVRALCTAEAAHSAAPLLIDEFTTELDRAAAAKLCYALCEFFAGRSQSGIRIIFASVFEDVAAFLSPVLSWVMLTRSGKVVQGEQVAKHQEPPPTLPSEPNFCPPKLTAVLEAVEDNPTKQRLWKEYFEQHHYLSGELQNQAYVVVARDADSGTPIGFLAVKITPGRQFCSCHHGNSHCMMEHRLVVRPAWQGFGLGTKLSDEFGRRFTELGEKYVGKTAHPRLAVHRERSSQWQRHGKFMAAIDQLVVRSDGSAELRGPSLGFIRPSQKALVFGNVTTPTPSPAGCLDNCPPEALAALQEQLLHGVSGSCTAPFSATVSLPGARPGTWAVEGQVVFFRPHNKLVKASSRDKTLEFELRGLGLGQRLMLVSKKEGPDRLLLKRAAPGKAGRANIVYRVSADALRVAGFPSGGEAFKAVARLALGAEGAESEEANLEEAFRRLRDSVPLPPAADAPTDRLPRGFMSAIQNAQHLRVTFSHEYIAGMQTVV
ncbi:unnamed protein product [Polarella glacialis]|uniref:AAA+ ATPase domain-containing protein n=1 Tax=Polarella glacialis TaxID=89957 RepID=A0A813KZ52_POLGL|nr:unnamed protein product [Polarella glacialis]